MHPRVTTKWEARSSLPTKDQETLTKPLTLGMKSNRNSSSPKHVYFINTITIISKKDEPREAGIIEPNATKKNDHNTIVEVEEKVIEEGESQDIERDNLDDRVCRDTNEVEEEGEWMEIEKGDPSNLKISCMIGRKDMHVFVGNMSHVMDFTIIENLEANIDPILSQVVFGRPFVEITKLILDRERGLITFTDGIKEVTFKTPYKDSEMDDLTSEGHDLLSSRESDRLDLDASSEVGGSMRSDVSAEGGVT
ncbi:hypothetical protein Tco_1570855 [Tanacetum coccineum]